MPAFDLQSAQPLSLFAWDGADSLGKGPDMAFRIARPVLPFTVELVGRLLDDLGSRRPCTITVGIYPA